MARANPLWGAPRIHGELLKLGFDVSERTISRLMPRRRTPPSQTWRTFLENHLGSTVAIDFFSVPTLTYRILFVFVVLAHGVAVDGSEAVTRAGSVIVVFFPAVARRARGSAGGRRPQSGRESVAARSAR